MPKKSSTIEKISCAPFGDKFGVCQVESVVSMDDRGQMVLPKDMRTRMKLKPGEKLTLVSWTRKGKITSISLLKAEQLNELIKEFYERA